IGLIGVILTFFFAKTFAGEKVAYLTTSLLATDPSYIFYIRHDFGPVAVMMVCKMASLILLIHWWRSNPRLNRGLIFLILASLALGLGFWDKFNFIWFIAALLLTMWVLYPKELRLRNGYKLILIASFTALVAGIVFLIYYKAFGFYPSGFSGAIAVRFWVLRKVLDGTYLARMILGQDSLLYQSFLPYLFYISFGFFPLVLIKKYDRKYLFIPLIILFIFAQVVVTRQALNGHHVLMLYPFIHLFCATAFVSVFDYLREKWVRVKPVLCVLSILIVFTIASNLLTLNSFYRELNRGGGRGYWTDAIYDVVEFLRGNQSGASKVVCLDWGYQLNILFLSGGKVDATTCDYIYGERVTDGLVRLFDDR
ncbi:MAG TPA: hypothetical protein VI387_12950, partial [Candidatus Brocadiales bacterium]|nr:hypothetical protein [Candidatus Brocadiales bacterium]